MEYHFDIGAVFAAVFGVIGTIIVAKTKSHASKSLTNPSADYLDRLFEIYAGLTEDLFDLKKKSEVLFFDGFDIVLRGEDEKRRVYEERRQNTIRAHEQLEQDFGKSEIFLPEDARTQIKALLKLSITLCNQYLLWYRHDILAYYEQALNDEKNGRETKKSFMEKLDEIVEILRKHVNEQPKPNILRRVFSKLGSMVSKSKSASTSGEERT